MMGNNRAVIVGWAAVSSAPQADEDKVSLTRQLAMNITEGRKWGQVVFQLIVPGESRDITLLEDAAERVTGWKMDSVGLDGLVGDALEAAIDAKLIALKTIERIHPYAELRAMIDNRSFHIFSFYNLGRVGRDAALSLTIMRLCQKANIFTYSTKAPPASIDASSRASYQANLMDAIMAVGYENEVRQIQENHRAGMIRRVERGRFPGKVNFGWVEIRDPKGKVTGYTIEEDAAKTVRLIVDWYLSRGWGALNIADSLNRLGHPAPDGGQWGHTQITFLLRRIWRYAGYGELNKYSRTGRPYIRAKGIWPPIITEEQARAVLAEQESRVGARRSVSNTYRYSRMVHCKICGSRMRAGVSHSKKKLKSGKVAQYTQTRYRCPADHIVIKEKFITARIEQAIELMQLDAEAFAIQQSQPTQPTTTEDEAAAVRKEIERLQAGILKADTDYYVSGAIDSDRHSAIVAAIKKQVATAQAELTRLADVAHDAQRDAQRGERIEDIRTHGHDYLTMKDVKSANAWLRRHFKVHVAPGRKIDVEII